MNYTARAFEQDSSEAMRGDIVRGLIELITNADDAYAASDARATGKISVLVEHRKNQAWCAVVRDHATGMTSATMKARLGDLGGRTSGFELGANRRGNLGRGAKDLAAFGAVEFESICQGKLGVFVLKKDGTWTNEGERSATAEDRERLGILRGNGTVATVRVEAGIRCPQHSNLQRRLSANFQLRDIFSDSSRTAELTNINAGTTERLVYSAPRTLPVIDQAIDIPGYPGVTARVSIGRLPERCEEGPEDSSRPAGLLIKGRRAIYDNTLFKYEGVHHAGWFTGRVECSYIDDLARAFDDLRADESRDPNNPIPIISRRRDGLTATHPFVQALTEAVEAILGKLVEEEAERARNESKTTESPGTRDALRRLARELGRAVVDELRDIEAEDLPGADGEGEAPLLVVIPEELVMFMGEDRTVTIAARRAGASVGDELRLELDPGGVVELLTPNPVLSLHPKREDVLVAQAKLRPLIADDAAMLNVALGVRTASALIDVRSARETVEEPIQQPESLSFDRPAYRVGWQRKKELLLVAPAEVVSAVGPVFDVSSSDPGVVVRSSTVELRYDDDLDFYTGKVVLEGLSLHATALVTVRKDFISASAHIKVTRREDEPEFRIELSADEMGTYRALIEEIENGQIVKVAARHPSISPYLGVGFEGQETPLVRSLIAEAVADAAARLVVSKLYRQRRSTEAFDVDRYYREHYKRVAKFLPRFQKILVGATPARDASPLLSGVPAQVVASAAPSPRRVGRARRRQ